MYIYIWYLHSEEYAVFLIYLITLYNVRGNYLFSTVVF